MLPVVLSGALLMVIMIMMMSLSLLAVGIVSRRRCCPHSALSAGCPWYISLLMLLIVWSSVAAAVDDFILGHNAYCLMCNI